MPELAKKRVLITGGAMGIGYCTAQQFARAGCELILTDVNGEALNHAAAEMRETGASVCTYTYDVSEQTRVEEVAVSVRDQIGDIDILINNAGIGHTGELVETSMSTWKKLMDVNFWGPLYHVYAYLPRMIERRSGHIVNVSSGQAYYRLPTWGAYACIKAALGIFSEILHFEVRKYNIKVTTVYPFMVNTPFYADLTGDTFGARLAMKLMPWYSMRPEKVGRIIFDAVNRGRKVEKVSFLNDIGFYAQFVPLASDLIAMGANLVLSKRVDAGGAS